MPITPYHGHTQFEYKPLGLEKFASPLAKMQEGFDIANTNLAASEFDLKYLPYGTDKERAQDLLETVDEKRNAIAENLLKTKNYRAAQKDLLELNKLWKKDPELNALRGNYESFIEWDKEQKDRVGKSREQNGITQADYEINKERAIAEFSGKGGTSFKADEVNPQGDYTTFGKRAKLANQAEQIEKIKLEISKANPADRITMFQSMGIDTDTMDKKTMEIITTSQSALDIKQATENYLATQPHFKEWATQDADDKYWKTAQTPKGLEELNSKLSNIAIQSIDRNTKSLQAKIADKKTSPAEREQLQEVLKEREADKAILNGMKATGEYDEEVMKDLYTQQHINKIFNADAVAQVLAFSQVDKNLIFRNLDTGTGTGSGTGTDQLGGTPWVSPASDMKWNIPNIKKEIRTSTGQLFNTVKAINDIGEVGKDKKGLMRKVVNANITNKEGYKNFSGMYEKQKAIFESINRGDSYEAFKKNVKSSGMSKASDKDIQQLYNTLQPTTNAKGKRVANYALQALNQGIQEGEATFINVKSNKENLFNIQKNVQENQEFKKFASEIGGSSPRNSYDSSFGVSRKDPKFKEAVNLFNAKTYTPEQLKKAGVDISKLKYAGSIDPNDKNKTITFPILSFDQVAKLKNYKNAVDAANKGFDFAGATVLDVYDWEDGKYQKGSTGKQISLKNVIDRSVDHVANKSNIVQEMSYDLVDVPKVGLSLQRAFPTINDVIQSLSAEGQGGFFKGQPGFDDKGNPLPGTNLDYSESKKPNLRFHGSQTYLRFPIKLEDGSKTSVVVIARKGMEPKLEETFLNVINASQGDSKLETTNRKTMYNNLFELRYPGNNITDVKGDQLKVDSKNLEETVGTVTTPNGTLSVVKRHTGERPIYILQDRGGNKVGEDFESVRAAREVMGEMIFGY